MSIVLFGVVAGQFPVLCVWLPENQKELITTH
jgi:hypothetical protein